MIRHSIIFVVSFALGALVCIAIRTRLHHPYTEPGSATAEPNNATSSSITPPPPLPSLPPLSSLPPPAAAHDQATMSADASKPVNTICAICGMAVNPALPTALYQQKIIGFGCKACPGKFAKDPEKYGPSALRNEVVE